MINVPGDQISMEGSVAMLGLYRTFPDFQGPNALPGPKFTYSNSI